MSNLLILDDDTPTLDLLCKLCRKAGHVVHGFTHGEDAFEHLRNEPVDLLVADLHLRRGSGLEIVSRSLQARPKLPVIMITANDTLEAAATAMRLGVFDFLTKPFKPAHLIDSIAKALKKKAATPVIQSDWIEPTDPLPNSASGNMQKALNMIERLSPLGCPILLQGEYGVGKLAVARWMHENNGRVSAPLVEVACVRTDEQDLINLFESKTTLNSSIYLAEVDTLTPRAQAMLNHLLDECVAKRSAWSQEDSETRRIIASTSNDLEQLTRMGHFREDLFYKLAVIPIRIPPLRERVEELPALVAEMLKRTSRDLHLRETPTLDLESMALLTQYNWPGNMVELRNALERACILSSGKTIRAEHLPTKLCLPSAFAPKMAWASSFPVGMSLHCFLKQQEHLFILETLKYFEGSRERCCSTLGISPATLYRKTGIRREKSRDPIGGMRGGD